MLLDAFLASQCMAAEPLQHPDIGACPMCPSCQFRDTSMGIYGRFLVHAYCCPETTGFWLTLASGCASHFTTLCLCAQASTSSPDEDLAQVSSELPIDVLLSTGELHNQRKDVNIECSNVKVLLRDRNTIIKKGWVDS